MKKNKTLRLASCLLIATLCSTCVISGTFAKYTTTDSANSTARVAEWGVEVVVESSAFAKMYVNEAVNAEPASVISSTEDMLVAPGTNGTLVEASISGSPEVDTKVTVVANLDLGTGWVIDDPSTVEVDSINYCPIKFTVDDGSGDPAVVVSVSNNNASLETTLEQAIYTALGVNTTTGIAEYNANDDLAKEVNVTWEWAFNGDDVKDTALGDLATAPEISFSLTITVTQVD